MGRQRDGFTTPSVTGVEVVGPAGQELAYNIHFEAGHDAWFASALVELVDHGAGTEADDWRDTAGPRRARRLAPPGLDHAPSIGHIGAPDPAPPISRMLP